MIHWEEQTTVTYKLDCYSSVHRTTAPADAAPFWHVQNQGRQTLSKYSTYKPKLEVEMDTKKSEARKERLSP